MSFLAKKKIFAWVSLLSLLLQITSSIFLYGPVYAQEVTPSPTTNENLSSPTPTPIETPLVSPELTPEPSATPEVTPTPDITPTPEASVEPSPSLEPTPTPEVTPTPETNVSPNNQPEAPPEVQGEQTQTTPSPEQAPEPTITPTPEPEENGKLAAAILKDTKADSIDELDLDFQGEGSAVISTDKLDYAPTDTVLVTGSGFVPDKTYTIYITSSDAPAVSHEGSVTADSEGNLFYSYQLDGISRPNYKVEVKDGEVVIATTTFTDPPPSPSGNLDQCRNGSAASPNDCLDLGGADGWVNGNAGGTQAHYVEGFSVPYREIMEDIPTGIGNPITITLGYDIKHSSKHAIDYLTHYNRLQPHTPFGHPAEAINPIDGVVGVSGTTTTFAIPAPSSAGSPVPGQPTTSFNALPAGERVMTLFGGTITNIAYVSEGNLGDAQAETRIAITFWADSSTAVLAWGGHIGSRLDWGFDGGVPRSAGGISGSPYHMRQISWTLDNLGNQDHSLSAGAVIPPGNLTIIKQIEPPDSSLWDFLTTGPNSYSHNTNDLPDGGQDVLSVVPGTYIITETTDPNYTTTVLCNTQETGTNSVTVDISSSESVVCTFTNTRSQGTIELKKVWSGTGGQTTLNIGTSAGGGQIAFQLTGAGGAAPLTTGTKTVDTGTYYVSETGGLTDYTSALACTDNGQTATPGAGNSLSVATGHTVICTFTNTRKTGTVIVKKVMVGGTDTFSYTGNPSGSISTNNGTIQQTVDTGQYTSTEGAKSGWNLTSIVCDDNNSTGNTSTRTATFNVEANETVTCTFTNTKISTLTVNKTLIPSSDSGLFNLQIDGATAGTGANVGDLGTTGAVEVTIGSHTVGETAGTLTSLSDYTFVISGDCGRDGSVALAAGENKTCTITNTRKPKLTVIKVTDPANDTGKFNLFVNSTQYATDVSNGGTTGAQYANIGANTFAENGGTGTNLSDYTSVVSGTGCSGSATAGTITLAAGDNKTCTITNTRKGSITIKKVTVGGDDSFTFTGDVAGSLSNNQTATSQVVAGTYHSTETGLAGWDLTEILCGDSDSSGVIGTGIATFNVASGENVTCTFTNTKRGHIIVKKVTNPSRDPQSFDFNASGGNYSNFSLTDQATPNDQELVPGVYGVSETGLSGWDLTNLNCTGGSGPINISLENRSGTVVLNAGETVTCTFTNTKRGSILAQKYNDINGNGNKQENEPGIQNWTIFMDKNANGQLDGSDPSGQTDSQGRIQFANLQPGTYSICEVEQIDWQKTQPSGSNCQNVTVNPGQDVTGVYFGNFACATISGTKWEDTNGNGQKDVNEVGLPNWTINLSKPAYNETDTTESDGSYSFKVCQPGLYTVSETNPDTNVWYQTYPGGIAPVHLVDVTSGGNYSSKDFGNARYAKISGIKYRDNDGDGVLDPDDILSTLEGWIIDLFDIDGYVRSVTTLAGGYYEFTGLLAGKAYYVLEQLKPGWTQTYGPVPTPTPFVVLSGENKHVDFANFEKGHISGHKWNDLNGNGIWDKPDEPAIQGWKIYLDRPEDSDIYDSTNSSGYYYFGDLGPGQYRVYELLSENPGWVQTAPNGNEYVINMTSDAIGLNNPNYDFGNRGDLSIKACKYEDSNGPLPEGNFTPVNNWNFALGQASPQNTGEDNCTIFNNLTPGTYDVTELPLPEGWFIADDSQGIKRVVLTNENQTVYFYNYRKGSISGMKFEDKNGNGVKDSGDGGLNEWRVYLDINNDNNFNAGEPNVWTSGGGNYSFGSLLPGDYTVREVLKDGWSQTAPAGGEYNITLISGQNETGKNFGNFRLGMMQGLKFNDIDGDGLPHETGEEYMNGWKFRLYTDWEDPVEVTTSNTGETGQYRFSNLGLGTYQVCEVLQDGWTQTWPNIGDNPVEDNGTIRPEHGVAVANESGEPDEAGVCWQTTITQSNDSNTYLRFGNSQKGTIIVRKVTDVREVEDTFDIDLTQEGLVHRYTLGSGDSESYDTLAGQYLLEEQAVAGWDLTSAVCTSDWQREITEFDPREGFTLHPGETIDCTFTNTYITPALTISKTNDATGDRHPGDSVLYTLTVKATKNFLNRVRVTDVLSDGFKYRSGSWTANSSNTSRGVGGDIKAGLIVLEPSYASPGVWDLGRLAKDETITLTYLADIDGGQNPGLYKDLAWASGYSGCSHFVMAEAIDPGYFSENFVGTQVNVIKDQQSGVGYNVESKVLGASTSMPATGADSRWLVFAGILFVLGWNVLLAGLILRRKHA